MNYRGRPCLCQSLHVKTMSLSRLASQPHGRGSGTPYTEAMVINVPHSTQKRVLTVPNLQLHISLLNKFSSPRFYR